MQGDRIDVSGIDALSGTTGELRFAQDASDKELENYPNSAEFKTKYGVQRKIVENGKLRIVRCGDKLGEVRVLESQFLEPEIHSLMGIEKYAVTEQDSKRSVFLIDKKKSEIRGTHDLKYIKWGESNSWHLAPTCRARATKNFNWYDLTRNERFQAILAKYNNTDSSLF